MLGISEAKFLLSKTHINSSPKAYCTFNYKELCKGRECEPYRAGNVNHIEMNKTSNLSTNYSTNHLKFDHRVYNKVQGAIKKQ